MKTKKHNITYWEKLYDLKIYDPDGWRDGKSMEDPLDEKEWQKRMGISTCQFGPNSMNIIKQME